MKPSLSPKDKTLLTLGAVPFVAVLGWVLLTPSLAGLALLVAAGFLWAGMALYRFHRASLKHVRDTFKDHTAQGEALLGLYSTLHIPIPLPRTGGTAAAPDFLNLIMTEILRRRPQVVVEAGSGISTLVVGHTLRKLGSGRVISLDHEAVFAEITRRNVQLHGLEEFVDVIHAPLVSHEVNGEERLWYDIQGLQGVAIDMLIVDGPPYGVQPMARYPSLPLLEGALTPQAVVLLDDADRPDERKTASFWKEQFADIHIREVPLHKGALVIETRASNS